MSTNPVPPEITDKHRDFVDRVIYRLTAESWATRDEYDLILDLLQDHFPGIGVLEPVPRSSDDEDDEWGVTDKHRQLADEYLKKRVAIHPGDPVSKAAAHDLLLNLTAKHFPGVGTSLTKIRDDNRAIAAETKRYTEIALQFWRDHPTRILNRPRDKDVFGFRDHSFEGNKYSCLVSMEFEKPSTDDPEYMTYVVEFVPGTQEVVEAYCT